MKEEFTIVDKRGANADVVPLAVIDKPIDVEKAVGAVKRMWKSPVAYLITNLNLNGSMVVCGRAAGLRSDGKPFVADYVFSPIWEAGFDWTREARKRLDTFLACDCNEMTGPCAYHKDAVNAWYKEGFDRIQADGQRPVPEVLEVIHRGEQARQSRLIVPGR